MNEIFSFRKELNIKKIIIMALLVLIIVVAILWIVFSHSEKTPNNEIKDNILISKFYSENQNICLKLSNSYNFTQYQPSLDYILELKNNNNLNIFIAEHSSFPNLTLSNIVSADLKTYISQFKNCSNISNVSEFNMGGKPAYTYSLHYLDNKIKTAFYLQTIWIEHGDKYYIIDIEFPLDSLNKNSKIINEVLNSLVIN